METSFSIFFRVKAATTIDIDDETTKTTTNQPTNQPPSTAFSRRILQIVVLLVALVFRGIARGLFVHQNSDKIYQQGAYWYRAVFPCFRHRRSNVSSFDTTA
jgi:hypothetical protein